MDSREIIQNQKKLGTDLKILISDFEALTETHVSEVIIERTNLTDDEGRIANSSVKIITKLTLPEFAQMHYENR